MPSGVATAGRTLSQVDAGVRAASELGASILRPRAAAILAYVPLTILVALASQSIPRGLGRLNVL